MQTRWLLFSILSLVFGIQSCSTVQKTIDIVQPLEQTPDMAVGMLDKHLVELDRNIAQLNERIADLKHLPDTPDPTIRELRALDLAGWELHQQQWVLQREHLQFARTQLQHVSQSPAEKPRLHEEWTKHEQAFEAAMGDFRQQRHALEQKRLQVEAQFIDNFLR